MKNSITKNPDTFQNSIKTFKMLIAGSNMAKYSIIILIGFSFFLMAHAEKTMLNIGSLFIGILALAFYLFKFLLIANMDQKSYTQMSLIASILKLKTYLTHRKKNEIYFTSIWSLSIIPFLSAHFESNANAFIAIIIFMVMVAIFGELSFKKTDKILKTLETTVQSE